MMLLLLAPAPSAFPQVPVLQRGYDSNVTGATLNETKLRADNVAPGSFGLLFKLPVDDAIYAQPLYVPNLRINGQLANALFVATMSDTVYAFDADTGALFGMRNLAVAVHAAPAPVDQFALSGSQNILGHLGILSTPVIDPSTNTLYAVTCTQEGITPSETNGTLVYRLHALDIGSGDDRPGSGVKIAASYGNSTFDARYQTQRVSLALAGNNVVFAFGAVEEEYAGAYVGWVMAYDKTTLTQSGVFATVTTGNRGGGVWQSGRPPAVDAQGNVYVFVGNGYGRGYDGVNNFSESVLKLDPAHGLKLLDWFTPSNWASLDDEDNDLTGSGPLLIPNTNLLAGGGKTGLLYVLNTQQLGKYDADDRQVVQKLQISTSELHGGPVFWQRSAANGGSLLYNWGVGDRLKAFAFDGSRLATNPVSRGAEANENFPGGTLTLSANGEDARSGVLWATTTASADAENGPPGPGVLHAYKAADVSQELWNSSMNSQDELGSLAKFVPPLVANGRVYVATSSGQVAVYGVR